MKYIKSYENIKWDEEEWEIEEDNNELLSDQPVSYYNQFIGRKVIIKDSSKYSSQNPIWNGGEKKPGTIINLSPDYDSDIIHDSSFIFQVEWDNDNYQNGYRLMDVELI